MIFSALLCIPQYLLKGVYIENFCVHKYYTYALDAVQLNIVRAWNMNKRHEIWINYIVL